MSGGTTSTPLGHNVVVTLMVGFPICSIMSRPGLTQYDIVRFGSRPAWLVGRTGDSTYIAHQFPSLERCGTNTDNV